MIYRRNERLSDIQNMKVAEIELKKSHSTNLRRKINYMVQKQEIPHIKSMGSA